MVVRYYSQDLPDVSNLKNYNPPIVSRVHASDGRLIAEFASERRVFMPINRIPQRVIDAFLSAEDKNFYRHPGIDFKGLLRAVSNNMSNYGQGKRPEGASTITQQVAKNMLIGNDTTITRKIKEAILAFRIEQTFTKNQILELYLNEIFLGQRAFGVASAALSYFNKTVDELTVAEAAFLAALPKAPNNYNPEKYHKVAIDRRNWVLSRMLENGKITPPEYQDAIKQDIVMVPRNEKEFYRGGGYFTEEIRRELVQVYGEDSVLKGGLLVRATIDPHMQDVANKALQNGLIAYDRQRGWRGPVAMIEDGQNVKDLLAKTPLPVGAETWQLAGVSDFTSNSAEIILKDGKQGIIPNDELKWAKSKVSKPSDVLKIGQVVLVEKLLKGENVYGLRQVPIVQGALVAMDANTGRVLAMAGGFSPTMSAFNRATQAWRQPGSSFKPFVYMTALENGFTPSSLILDAPISLPQGPGMPMWTPENYTHDYLGPTTLRVGLEKSRNLMTVRLAAQLGMDKIAATAEAFGVVDHLPRNLSMSLGAGETTVMRQTAAYAQMVNGGKKVVPTLIDSVQNKSGKIIYRHDVRACKSCQRVRWQDNLEVPVIPDLRQQIIDPRTAYQMVHILEGVITRGTGTRIKGLPWPLAGKTGTSNDAKDAWFVGFSANLAVGIYVGYDHPKPLGAHQTGGTVAAPIFRDFMDGALKGTPPVPFRVPSGLRLVRVNPATGQLAEAGDPAAIWEAFKPGTEPKPGMIESPVDPDVNWSEYQGSTDAINTPDQTPMEQAIPEGTLHQPMPQYLPPTNTTSPPSSNSGEGSGFGEIY